MGLFKKETYNEALEDKGFAITPLLSEDEVNALLEVFEKIKPGIDPGYYASIDSPDENYKKEADILIREIIEEPLQSIFRPIDLMTGSFIVKQPGKESLVYVHTDWTFTDESDGQPLVAWIPLHDVDSRNGALEVVEKSHRFVPKVRGPGIENTLLPYHKYLRRKWARIQPMKAGQGLFFKSNLVHCSPVNRTDQVRVAIRIEIVPRGRTTIICYQDDKSVGRVDIYKIPHDYFTTYVKGMKPEEGSLIESIPYEPPVFSKRLLRAHLQER